MKKVDFANWPFGLLVFLSVCLSALHGFLQIRWVALRYRTFGPRPTSVQAFIALEVLLQMLVFGIAMVNICGEDRSTKRSKYVIGEVATLGAWIVASFVL
jgi:hypothetical protein